MFDAIKSKLFPQIMASLATFFGKDPQSVTEAELHNELDGQAPLADQLAAARAAGAGDLAALNDRLATMEASINDMTSRVSDLEAEGAKKDDQIANLTAAATGHEQAMATAKAAHEKQVATLSGELASLRAGKLGDPGDEDEGHPAAKKTANGQTVIAIKSSALADLVKPKPSASYN